MALSYGATFISTAAIVGFGGVAANYVWNFMACILNIIVGYSLLSYSLVNEHVGWGII